MGAHSIIPLARLHGGIAQLARAFGSYPKCRWFKSDCRYQFGPVVKRLRHRPFTAVTRVRFSSGSPKKTDPQMRPVVSSVGFLFGRIAQLVRAFASHARGHGFESPCVHQKRSNFCLPKVTSFFIQAAGLAYHHASACISSP